MYGEVARRYPSGMSTSYDSGSGAGNISADVSGSRGSQAGDSNVQVNVYGVAVPPPAREQVVGVLRIEIRGSWSVADFAKLLGRLEDGYKATAALEFLADQPSGSALSQLPADELLQTAAAFRLAGGLRLGALSYASPGFLEVIGAFNPLKTLKDLITEILEINRKRDETRRFDERERERQAMDHEEAMTRLALERESVWLEKMDNIVGRLSPRQQSVTAAQLIERVTAATGEIANDKRVDGVTLRGVDGVTRQMRDYYSSPPQPRYIPGPPEGSESPPTRVG